MYRIWWLGFVAYVATASHADAVRWDSEAIVRVYLSRLAHYFNAPGPGIGTKRRKCPFHGRRIFELSPMVHLY